MIASLSIPSVSLVLGGSHSIGVPLAVASDYSFIVPTGTMMVHPVRMSGMVIGTSRTYDYFEMIQDIDLGNLELNNGSWNPIGWYQNEEEIGNQVSHGFSGNFDGCGKI